MFDDETKVSSISYRIECNVSPYRRQKSHIFCFNSHRLFETQTWENVNALLAPNQERSTKEKEIRRQVFRLYASLPLNWPILFGSASLERGILDSRLGTKPNRRQSLMLWSLTAADSILHEVQVIFCVWKY